VARYDVDPERIRIRCDRFKDGTARDQWTNVSHEIFRRMGLEGDGYEVSSLIDDKRFNIDIKTFDQHEFKGPHRSWDDLWTAVSFKVIVSNDRLIVDYDSGSETYSCVGDNCTNLKGADYNKIRLLVNGDIMIERDWNYGRNQPDIVYKRTK
jgi:hypothetical protein